MKKNKSNSRFILLVFLLEFFFVSANAQVGPTIYYELPIPKPEGLPYFKTSDFKIDKERLSLYSDDFLYGSRQVLDKLCSFIQKEPAGIRMWEKAAEETARLLNKWELDRANFERYVYRLYQLEDLSMVYLFSGHKELGQFIRDHVLRIAESPYEFWLHTELRRFDIDAPRGGLETAVVCNAMAMSLAIAGELFSETEIEQVNQALKEKGLIPGINWLKANKSAVNNWLAVVSSAAYHTAMYLGEKERADYALQRLIGYMNNSIETDGSCGEGTGYFEYPLESMFHALLAMGPDGRVKNTASSPIKHSASWRAYPYMLPSNGYDRSAILYFGDNSYINPMEPAAELVNPMNPTVAVILGSVFQNPVAPWLMETVGGMYDLKDMLLYFADNSVMPKPRSPREMGLPLVKSFEAGDSYMRSTWEDDGIVLGMWSGNGSRVKFSHQRPEFGSICMGAYGEYLIVSPGSASYRSDLRYQWDITTKAANTITIDDKNQLFSRAPLYGWNKTDISEFWELGNPKAEILQCESGEIADLLVNEMALAYHVPMNTLRRTVLFIKDPGYFLVIDKIEAKEDAHKYTWRMHLNNKDGKGNLERKSPDHWFFSRPFADMDIHLFSDQKITVQQEQGYLHGPRRDYSPGGINEGALGTSVGLAAHNVQKTSSMMYYSVIFPAKKGTATPKVTYKKNRISVGDDIITLKNGECIVSQKKKTEKYILWE